MDVDLDWMAHHSQEPIEVLMRAALFDELSVVHMAIDEFQLKQVKTVNGCKAFFLRLAMFL